MADKRCTRCGNSFPATSEFFRRNRGILRPECKVCSKKHYNGYKPTKNNAICAFCQKPFYKSPAQSTNIHCSITCRKAAQQRKGNKTWRDYPPHPHYAKTFACAYCGKEFQTKWNTRFCSRNCASRYVNEPRQWPMRSCQHCRKEFRPRKNRRFFCSQVCKEQGSPKVALQHRTDIEAIVEQCLQSMNITYEWEKQFGRCRVDFYLPEYHMAIECDGSYWHKNKERDEKRDARLRKEHGITIKRFTDKQIFGNIRDLIIDALAS